MSKRVRHPSVREGYDLWSHTYDATPNPLVALDRRITPRAIDAGPGEWVLDAGCGTGAHLARLSAASVRPVGIDFSRGMLRVARRTVPLAALVQANLDHISEAGFRRLEWREHRGDDQLASEVPAASKYLGQPLLVVVRAVRA